MSSSYFKMNQSIKELREICKSKGLKGYSTLKKDDLLKLLKIDNKPNSQIHRLNYIGSKFQLLEWLEENIKKFTNIKNFENVKFADIFSGTGVVSYYFRNLKAEVLSNDSELYSSIITHSFVKSVFTDKCKEFIDNINSEVGKKVGFITNNYSPYKDCERKFFTIENAMLIDYTREKLEKSRNDFDNDEYNFILASIITSADSVSNVPAVYGCYLKKFKEKAIKRFVLKPVHNIKEKGNENSKIFNKDVLDLSLASDIVYLDPPYNERQYSKNYFPLGVIALPPDEQIKLGSLKGKTGIPENCFISSFCKKGESEKTFEKMLNNIKSKFIFLSYNSEGIVPIENLIKIFEKHGRVKLVEKEYKRFKSFDYDVDTESKIKEYLVCLDTTANNEKLGRITEKAITNTFDIDFIGSYKYDTETAKKLKSRFEKLPYFFNYKYINHIANKGSRYDFSGKNDLETDKENYLSVKSSKQKNGKICPQVIGQAVHNTFCNYFNLSRSCKKEDIKNFILNNIKKLLCDYFKYTFDCDIFYYNEYSNKCLYIKSKNDVAINFEKYIFKFSKTLENWNESNTLYFVKDDKKISIGEFQIHNHRDGIKYRWNFENFLEIFNEYFEINVL